MTDAATNQADAAAQDPDAELMGTPGPDKLRVLLIAPDKALVLECFIDASKTIKEMYRLIECSTVDLVRTIGEDWGGKSIKQVTDNVDLWVDDEGLMVEPSEESPVYLTYVPGVPQALAGRIMMAGSDAEGNTRSLPDWITAEDVCQLIVGRKNDGT